MLSLSSLDRQLSQGKTKETIDSRLGFTNTGVLELEETEEDMEWMKRALFHQGTTET